MTSEKNIGYRIPYISNPNVVTGAQYATIAEPILARALMFIQEGNWDKAEEYTERVLDKYPQNGIPYLCKLMIEFKVQFAGCLFELGNKIFASSNYSYLQAFGDEGLKIFLAVEALGIIYSRSLKIDENIKSNNFEFDLIMTQIQNAENEFLKVREYYDTVTGVKGAYATNDSYCLLEATTAISLAECRLDISRFLAQKEAVYGLIERVKQLDSDIVNTIVSGWIINQSKAFINKNDYDAACGLLSVAPYYEERAESFQEQASLIIENLIAAPISPSSLMEYYLSEAIDIILLYSNRYQQHFGLILKSLESFEFEPNKVLYYVHEISRNDLLLERLDSFVLSYANKLPDSELKTSFLQYSADLKIRIQSNKKREAHQNTLLRKAEIKKKTRESCSLLIVLGAAIWGLIMGFNTITHEVMFYEIIHPWIFVFLITFTVMTIFSATAGQYKKVTTTITNVSGAWQVFAWFYYNVDAWFLGDPDWILCIPDFLSEFLVPFLVAVICVAACRYVCKKLS